MHKFTRLIDQARHHHATDAFCSEIKKLFKVNDERSKQLSLSDALHFQFWAHMCLDSTEIDGEMFNRYNGDDDGEGLYPERMDSPLLTKDNRFKLSEFGLPVLSPIDEKAPLEMTVDAHRGNENRVLKAGHLLGAVIHNKRMDEHGDYKLAKAETISTMCQRTLNAALALCQMDEKEFFDIQVPGVNYSLEWNFAISRWAHAQMPDTVNGRPVFEKGPSKTVDMISLHAVEFARDLNLGVSRSMTEMDHLKSKPFSILERTFSRHNELKLPSWHDLAELYGMEVHDSINEGTPIWPGILMEAEQNNGMLGCLGRRVVADGLAGSLLWGRDIGQGLWFPRGKTWSNPPVKTLEILKYGQL